MTSDDPIQVGGSCVEAANERIWLYASRISPGLPRLPLHFAEPSGRSLAEEEPSYVYF